MAPKRKRAHTATKDTSTKNPDDASNETLPDASNDDAAGELKTPKQKSTESMDPPSKRTRSTKTDTNDDGNHDGSDEVDHEDEMEDDEMANGDGDAGFGAGENGEAEKMKMDAPPKAGLIDPVGGYHTNQPPKDRPVRVYADGVFDLFHLGHMRQLEQAKTAFPDTYLLVGVTGDRETHRRKGLTVLSGKERAETVRHCKWVDEVIEDCPWVVTVDFLEKHEIDYVAHDDLPYGAAEGDDIYKPLKEKGMFLVTQRTEGVSTTGIITKIVRDYESYIARQLKRGTTRQELNISWLKKNELDIKRHVAEIRNNIRTNWTVAGQELGKDFRQFWQPSRPSSPAPSIGPATRRGRRSDVSSLQSPSSGNEKSPGGMSRLSIPRSLRQEAGGRGDRDFVAGYAMGLIGGVKSWMQRTRRNIDDSRPVSPGSEEEEDDAKSPVSEAGRGRERGEQEALDAQLSS